MKNSRWRRYAFGNEDWDEYITARQRSDGTWLLSVNRSGEDGDEVPRTVVDTWKDTDGNDIGEVSTTLQSEIFMTNFSDMV
jgi:hypothetical protein